MDPIRCRFAGRQVISYIRVEFAEFPPSACVSIATMEAQAHQQQPQPSGAGKEEILGKKKKKKQQQLVVKKTKLKQEVIDVILKEPFEPLGGGDDVGGDEVLMGGMSEPYRDCHAKSQGCP